MDITIYLMEVVLVMELLPETIWNSLMPELKLTHPEQVVMR